MQYRKRMLRKKGTALLLSALLLASALPLAAYAEEVSAKTTEYVNFRSGPGTNYSSQGIIRHQHYSNGYEQFRVVRRASF